MEFPGFGFGESDPHRSWTVVTGLFVRKVKTAAGATAFQITGKSRGVRTILEHLESTQGEVRFAATRPGDWTRRIRSRCRA